MQKISFKKLIYMFWIFFKIGAFTIGGGLAMIPVIKREVVDKQGWLGDDEVIDVFAISQSLPGVIAINSSIFLGYKMAGLMGAVVSALGVILPSLIIILLIFFIFPALTANIYVQKAFSGVRACITAMICVSLFKMAKNTLKDMFSYIIAALVFISVAFLSLDIAVVVIGSGLIGYIIYLAKEKLTESKGGGTNNTL